MRNKSSSQTGRLLQSRTEDIMQLAKPDPFCRLIPRMIIAFILALTLFPVRVLASDLHNSAQTKLNPVCKDIRQLYLQQVGLAEAKLIPESDNSNVRQYHVDVDGDGSVDDITVFRTGNGTLSLAIRSTNIDDLFLEFERSIDLLKIKNTIFIAANMIAPANRMEVPRVYSFREKKFTEICRFKKALQ